MIQILVVFLEAWDGLHEIAAAIRTSSRLAGGMLRQSSLSAMACNPSIRGGRVSCVTRNPANLSTSLCHMYSKMGRERRRSRKHELTYRVNILTFEPEDLKQRISQVSHGSETRSVPHLHSQYRPFGPRKIPTSLSHWYIRTGNAYS